MRAAKEFTLKGLIFFEREVTQSCPTLCDPMDYSLPGSSICGVFQARILEWVAISFSRRSSPPRDRTQVSQTAGRLFTVCAIREAPFFEKEVGIGRSVD